MKTGVLEKLRRMTAIFALAIGLAGSQSLWAQSTQPGGAPDPAAGAAPVEPDPEGDLCVEFDEFGQITISGIYADGEDPSTWEVLFYPDVNDPSNVALAVNVTADPDGFFVMGTNPLAASIGPNGATLTVRSPNVPNASIIVYLPPQAGWPLIQRPAPRPPQPPPAKTNRMRIQLQTGTGPQSTPLSEVIEHDNSPVTVAEINAALDRLFDNYQKGLFGPNSKTPPRDRATEAALKDAIAKMKRDVAKLPPNGYAESQEFIRKSFRVCPGSIFTPLVCNGTARLSPPAAAA